MAWSRSFRCLIGKNRIGQEFLSIIYLEAPDTVVPQIIGKHIVMIRSHLAAMDMRYNAAPLPMHIKILRFWCHTSIFLDWEYRNITPIIIGCHHISAI